MKHLIGIIFLGVISLMITACGSGSSSQQAASDLINTSPQDQTVIEGQTATFQVSASSPGQLSYQWQRNGSDIPGANASSYETPPLSLADDGAIFTVRVWTTTDSEMSLPATIHVYSDDPGSEIIVEPNQTLPTAPHRFDVYRAAGADKMIVFLHGGGGTKEHLAYQLGLKREDGDSNYDVVNEQILLDNNAIAIFVQGQAILAASTWDNYAMVSGENDMQFIRDMVSYITNRYNVSRTYIVGHSMGGVMVNRIWCEAPELFDAFVSIAGPPSSHFLNAQTPCSPTDVKPYLSIIGSQDDVLQNYDWDALTWTIVPRLTWGLAFVNPDVIGERYFLPSRVIWRCNEMVQDGDANAIKEGTFTEWSFCDNSIRLLRIEQGGHSIELLESASGRTMMELVFEFIDGL